MAWLDIKKGDDPATIPERDGLRYLDGDLIAAHDDSWQPGNAEKNAPDHELVFVPGLSPTAPEILALLETPLVNGRQVPERRRIAKLDMVALKEAAGRLDSTDSKRGKVAQIDAVEIVKCTKAAASIDALKRGPR